MSPRPAPPWLGELQARFGAVLRTPLDRSTGTLRASIDAFPPDAIDDAVDGPHGAAPQRLAVYHRQYWFRLFGVMQSAFPLTARLFGHWHFNGVVTGYVLAHAPRSWDIDRVPDGFAPYLRSVALAETQREALLEAADLDATWRALFRAPTVAPYHPGADDAARLLEARLVPSPATAVVVLRWPWLELKRALASAPGESIVAVPALLAEPRAWALLREPGGIRQLLLEPREAQLLLALGRVTVGAALAEVEAACPPEERQALPSRARQWLARSVERGMWSGLADAGAQGTTQL